MSRLTAEQRALFWKERGPSILIQLALGGLLGAFAAIALWRVIGTL